jgi:NAD(P)-dependent dehydrogenase (short-subunit alcohol dehydrogenase family)
MTDATTLLVVGGGSGIGLAAARLAAAAGTRVVVADIDADAAATVRQLDGDVTFVRCDATEPDSVRAMVDAAAARLHRLDGVLTTVGGAHLAPIEEVEPEDWDRELAFNLTSAYLVCRAIAPVMQRRRSGAIVTTASGFALLAATDRAAYAAAKAGVISLSRSLAATLAPDRIRVNCLAPGPTDTPRFRAMNGGDEGVARVRASMPLGEIPTPEDCAHVALFLLSDLARAVTGQVIHVNGGLITP